MSIASELQDKINAKAAIKTAIEAKGVTVGDIKVKSICCKDWTKFSKVAQAIG